MHFSPAPCSPAPFASCDGAAACVSAACLRNNRNNNASLPQAGD